MPENSRALLGFRVIAVALFGAAIVLALQLAAIGVAAFVGVFAPLKPGAATLVGTWAAISIHLAGVLRGT